MKQVTGPVYGTKGPACGWSVSGWNSRPRRTRPAAGCPYTPAFLAGRRVRVTVTPGVADEGPLSLS